jgi:hypothetical protein
MASDVTAVATHRRNDGKLEDFPSEDHALTVSESWVEIASQPSSSSLSSIGDEIITTGLRVGPSSYPPRRRRLHQMHLAQQMPASHVVVPHAAAQAGTSSQEEYDETESEEDRVMTSSNEHIPPDQAPHHQLAVASESEAEDDDDDENATALGRPSGSPTFRPQPNAFSHPPSHLTHRHSTSSAVPRRPPYLRQSMSQRSHTRAHRGVPNFMSPSYQADNDAALRASLTTLLSCAAAARGLPKKDNELAGPSGSAGIGAGIIPSSQPMGLRLVPESELMADPAAPASATPATASRLRHQVPARAVSNSSSASPPTSTSSRDQREDATDKTRRHSLPQARSPRAAKKKRTAGVAVEASTDVAAYISPTVMTWVVSAGVLVLVSVVGFGAGYVIGREVGRQEGSALTVGSSVGTAANSTSCGTELIKSTSSGTLRRFRWGAMARSAAA